MNLLSLHLFENFKESFYTSPEFQSAVLLMGLCAIVFAITIIVGKIQEYK